MAKTSIAFTGHDGNMAMVCGGVAKGGLLWFRISKRCVGQYKWIRCAIETLRLIRKEVGTRMYSYVLDGFKDGERLASSVGMHKTDLKENYNGNTYYIWLRE